MRDALEQLYRDQPEEPCSQRFVCSICRDGRKELGPKASGACNGAWTPCERSRDWPGFEENLALIQTMVGENSRAISTLAELLQIPYHSAFYGASPITPALLRLDPVWDPLRGDPAFQKLCEEKKP